MEQEKKEVQHHKKEKIIKQTIAPLAFPMHNRLIQVNEK